MAKGDCYAANGRVVMNMMSAPDAKKWKLCHGVGILQTDGKPFGHAWVEYGNKCIDKSNGKSIELPKKLYYEIGNIPVKGYKIYKYSPEQAGLKMVRNKHWGPWDSKPPR